MIFFNKIEYRNNQLLFFFKSDLSSKYFGGFQETLTVCIGCKVMILHNYSPKHGVMNGTLGKVTGWTYDNAIKKDPNKFTKPQFITVKVDNYKGVQFNELEENEIPIDIRFKSHRNDQNLHRKQFAMMLASALTIHKAQGGNFGDYILNISEKEFMSGLVLTGITRGKCWLNYTHSSSLYEYFSQCAKLPIMNTKRSQEKILFDKHKIFNDEFTKFYKKFINE